MLSAIRKRLTYTNVAMTLALVFAMSGGAYAAGKYLITSTKQISPKVLKSLKGASGAKGANGATGPAGASGPAGPTGPTGPAGGAGPAGSNGASATTESFAGNAHGCKEGGTLVKSASGETPVCNGEKGKQGTPGTPGAIHPGETLPSGASETGVWVDSAAVGTQQPAAISFPIPLAEPLAWGEGIAGEPENQVHYINQLGKEVPSVGTELSSHPACLGTVEKPEATPGNLCIYAHIASPTGQNENITNPAGGATFGFGAATTGALLDAAESRGTWAVTAK
jgi:hypothetical protein